MAAFVAVNAATGIVALGVEVLRVSVKSELDIDVPSPFRSPVTVVDSVIAGVVVGFATVPASPFADTTEMLVTAPLLPPAHEIHEDPFHLYAIPVSRACRISPVVFHEEGRLVDVSTGDDQLSPWTMMVFSPTTPPTVENFSRSRSLMLAIL